MYIELRRLYDSEVCSSSNYVSPIVFDVGFVVCLSVRPFVRQSVRPSVRPSVCPSVCLSVCPSRLCVSSIYFAPLVGLTNYSAQMSNMMSRCAVHMFDQGLFKVKVIFKHYMNVFRVRSIF